MTQQTPPGIGYGSPQPGASPGAQASVKDKAGESAQAGHQAAEQVAQNAAEHAQELAQEAQTQARNLMGEARDQVRGQAGAQQQNAVSKLRSLGDQLRSMASNGQQGQVATDLVSQTADRAHGVADWLDQRQPEDVLEELRRFARRRPGTFLLGALAAGVFAGRLTRGAVAVHTEDSGDVAPPLPGPGDTATATGAGGDYSSGSTTGPGGVS
jgi:hypothetical protein